MTTAMKELRDTIGVALLLIGIAASFFLPAIFFAMAWTQDRSVDMYLLKVLAIDIMVIILSFSFLGILTDDVWSKDRHKKNQKNHHG